MVFVEGGLKSEHRVTDSFFEAGLVDSPELRGGSLLLYLVNRSPSKRTKDHPPPNHDATLKLIHKRHRYWPWAPYRHAVCKRCTRCPLYGHVRGQARLDGVIDFTPTDLAVRTCMSIIHMAPRAPPNPSKHAFPLHLYV